MKKWLFRIVWIPALALAVLFLVANRQFVAISLDPFSADAPALTTVALPLWFWLMTMLFIGLCAGVLGMWLSGRPKRHKAHVEHRELKMLRKDLAQARAKIEEIEAQRQPEPETIAAPLLESKDV